MTFVTAMQMRNADPSTRPAISVLMPVYNAARYIGAAIDSILLQSFGDFEFVIVDDSTDSSRGIIDGFLRRDPRIRVISGPGRGIVGALNDGLAVCRGEFIARMDADDLCEAGRFELQFARLEREPELVALGSCAVAIDPDGEILGDAPVPLTHDEIESQHLRGISSIYHPAVMMRAEAVRRVGGYREGLCPCEDYDLWLRMAEVGRLANLPQPLFIWRRTATGLLAGKAGVMQSTLQRVLSDAWKRRGMPGRPTLPKYECPTQVDLFRQWSWLALRHGYLRTARKYAMKCVLSEPANSASWRLAYCAIRGH